MNSKGVARCVDDLIFELFLAHLGEILLEHRKERVDAVMHVLRRVSRRLDDEPQVHDRQIHLRHHEDLRSSVRAGQRKPGLNDYLRGGKMEIAISLAGPLLLTT